MKPGYVKAVGVYLPEAIKTISKKRKSQLQPLFEALTNSFEAIPLLDKGNISIRLYIHKDLYTDEKGKSSTEKFEFVKLIVSDNGKGFDETEFSRFSTLWDNSKLKNNRGTGRIQFLHFFEKRTFQVFIRIRLINLEIVNLFYQNHLIFLITYPAIYILTYDKNDGMIESWKSKTAGS
jgi:hypothetical protein